MAIVTTATAVVVVGVISIVVVVYSGLVTSFICVIVSVIVVVPADQTVMIRCDNLDVANSNECNTHNVSIRPKKLVASCDFFNTH